MLIDKNFIVNTTIGLILGVLILVGLYQLQVTYRAFWYEVVPIVVNMQKAQQQAIQPHTPVPDKK